VTLVKNHNILEVSRPIKVLIGPIKALPGGARQGSNRSSVECASRG